MPTVTLGTDAKSRAALTLRTMPTRVAAAMGQADRPARRHALNLLITEIGTRQHDLMQLGCKIRGAFAQAAALTALTLVLGALVDGV